MKVSRKSWHYRYLAWVNFGYEVRKERSVDYFSWLMLAVILSPLAIPFVALSNWADKNGWTNLEVIN